MPWTNIITLENRGDTMEKLGCLSEREKLSLAESCMSDSEIVEILGNATALYLRFKSINLIEIDFIENTLYIYFNSFYLTVKNEFYSLEDLYRKIEDKIIIQAMKGAL